MTWIAVGARAWAPMWAEAWGLLAEDAALAQQMDMARAGAGTADELEKVVLPGARRPAPGRLGRERREAHWVDVGPWVGHRFPEAEPALPMGLSGDLPQNRSLDPRQAGDPGHSHATRIELQEVKQVVFRRLPPGSRTMRMSGLGAGETSWELVLGALSLPLCERSRGVRALVSECVVMSKSRRQARDWHTLAYQRTRCAGGLGVAISLRSMCRLGRATSASA